MDSLSPFAGQGDTSHERSRTNCTASRTASPRLLPLPRRHMRLARKPANAFIGHVPDEVEQRQRDIRRALLRVRRSTARPGYPGHKLGGARQGCVRGVSAGRDGDVCEARIEAAARVMTATTHPYLRAEQFADRTFLRVRLQVARLLLPHSLPASQEQLRMLIQIYDDLIGERPTNAN